MIKTTLAVIAESSVIVALCILVSALTSSITALSDPVWWMLALFLGIFWGAVVAGVAGGALFGLLCLLRHLPRGFWIMVATAAIFAGLGVLAFDVFVLQRAPNGIDVVLMCLAAVVAGVLVSRRMRSEAATKAV